MPSHHPALMSTGSRPGSSEASAAALTEPSFGSLPKNTQWTWSVRRSPPENDPAPMACSPPTPLPLPNAGCHPQPPLPLIPTRITNTVARQASYRLLVPPLSHAGLHLQPLLPYHLIPAWKYKTVARQVPC